MSYNTSDDPDYSVAAQYDARLRSSTDDSTSSSTSATSGGSGLYYIDPTTAAANPSWAQGQLARSQWDDFLARYKPLEDQTMALVNRDPTAEINAAGAQGQAQSDSAQAALQRDTERRGLTVTPEQAMALAHKNKMQDSLAVMGAKNSATRQIADRNLNAATSLVSIGKGIASGASTDLSGASSLQSRRQSADAASSASAKAQNTQLAGTAAGLALAAIFGV